MVEVVVGSEILVDLATCLDDGAHEREAEGRHEWCLEYWTRELSRRLERARGIFDIVGSQVGERDRLVEVGWRNEGGGLRLSQAIDVGSGNCFCLPCERLETPSYLRRV